MQVGNLKPFRFLLALTRIANARSEDHAIYASWLRQRGWTFVGIFALSCLAGCVTNVETLGTPRAESQEHARNVRAYMREVDGILGRELRKIRVAEEAAKMKAAGHPVPLATGLCSEVAIVRNDGKVVAVRDANCVNDELAIEIKQAILESSPFPPPPLIHHHKQANVWVRLTAPVATPGVYGN